MKRLLLAGLIAVAVWAGIYFGMPIGGDDADTDDSRGVRASPVPSPSVDAMPGPPWGPAIATPAPEPTDGPEPDSPEPRADAAAASPASLGAASESERGEPPPEPAAPVAEPGLPLSGTVVEAFLAGYRAGGGDPAWEEHFVNDVIPCESGWQVDTEGGFLGLAQFHPGTWNMAKCSADAAWWDPWEQGCAVANWMAQIPGRWGTTAGWPHCWWEGL